MRVDLPQPESPGLKKIGKLSDWKFLALNVFCFASLSTYQQKEWWYLLHHYYRFVRFPPDSTSPPLSTSFSLMTSQFNQVPVYLRCDQRTRNEMPVVKGNRSLTRSEMHGVRDSQARKC